MLSKLFAWFTAPEVFLGDKLRGRTTADVAVEAFPRTEASCLLPHHPAMVSSQGGARRATCQYLTPGLLLRAGVTGG